MSLQEYVSQQFVGKDKSKQDILNEIYKAGKDAWNDKLGYIPLKPMALITVHNPNSSIIESIGFSEPTDILTNIFGASFGAMFNSGGTVSRNIQDEDGIVRTIWMNDQNGNQYTRNNGGTSVGMQMQIGRGLGTFNRSDFNLTDPFVVAPESNKFTISPGGWNSGNQQVVVNGLLTNVTTSDSIGECALWARWYVQIGVNNTKFFLLSHDLAGASFSSGQNINVTYTWSIT